MAGKIFVGQKNTRGVKGQKAVRADGFKSIDVTSASRNLLGAARIPATTLSPMKLGPVVDEQGLASVIFENYWQFSKYWKSADHIDPMGQPTAKWIEFRKKGFVLAKGKRRPLPLRQYGRPNGSIYNDKNYTYLESRKQIYVPVYARLIRDLPAIAALKEMVRNGENIMILDNDGPPRDLYPSGMEMTEQNWDRLVNDARHPFGHGYVVAAVVANLVSVDDESDGEKKSAKKRKREQDADELEN